MLQYTWNRIKLLIDERIEDRLRRAWKNTAWCKTCRVAFLQNFTQPEEITHCSRCAPILVAKRQEKERLFSWVESNPAQAAACQDNYTRGKEGKKRG